MRREGGGEECGWGVACEGPVTGGSVVKDLFLGYSIGLFGRGRRSLDLLERWEKVHRKGVLDRAH